MPDAPAQNAKSANALTAGHWIGIATIAIAAFSAVLGWGLSEHNARLANVDARTTRLVEGQGHLQGDIKATNERLNGLEQRLDERLEGLERRLEERLNGVEQRVNDRLSRIETNIERLLELHIGAATPQGAAPAAE